MISFDDFKKIEIKIGTILTVEPVEGSEKLLKLTVDFGLKPSATPEISPEPVETKQEDVEIEKEEKDNVTTLEAVAVEETHDIRTVVSGIAKYVDVGTLAGKQFSFVTNLEPRPIMGIESRAMILAAKDETDFAILMPSKPLSSGASVS